MERILVAVDFSETSCIALRAAFELSETFQSSLEVLYVAPTIPIELGWEDYAAMLRIEEARLRQELEALIRNELKTTPDKLSRIVVKVAEGESDHTIVEAANHSPNTLIVVGSHGRSTLGRAFLGSVSSRVLRQAKTPVLIVKGSHERPRKILAAIDLGASTDGVLRTARLWQQALGAELNLVHVLDLAPDPVLERLYLGPELYRFQQSRDEFSRQKVQAAAEQVFAADALPEIHFPLGWPATEIGMLVKEEHFDLVIVGAHERHGLLDFGNTALRIAHTIPCSLLASRSQPSP